MPKKFTLAVAVITVLTVLVMLPLPREAEASGRYNRVTVDDDGPADYADIQEAVDFEPDGTRIEVQPGTYGGFAVIDRDDLRIEGKNKDTDVIVTVSIAVTTYRGTDTLTIAVVDSTAIEIKKLTVQAGADDPFGIAYFNSTGKVKDNEVAGNTGNISPGTAIAAFGISNPGEVKIEKNFVHDYGKIGILASSRLNGAGDYVPGGIFARIKDNIVVGTDFEDYYRVQDGIQITYGGSARIEKNDISGNLQTGGSRWTCDGILIYAAYEVETRHNLIYNNKRGITIQKFVDYARLERDDIQGNEWGLYTWNWMESTIEVEHAKIRKNQYGWVNFDSDGIICDRCQLKENTYGIYTDAAGTENPAAAMNHCRIEKNTDFDVVQGTEPNTLVLHKTRYDTYYNLGGGVLIEQ